MSCQTVELSGPHGFVTCHKCCTDYSFMEDVLDEDTEDIEDDSDLPELVSSPSSGPGPEGEGHWSGVPFQV